MLLGPVVVLLLAGCGDGGASGPGAAAPPKGGDRHPPSHSATAGATPGRTPAPTHTPTPAHRRARDGRDLDACRDRTCEVEVRQGDTVRFSARFVTDTFTIERITDDRVDFSATDDQPAPLRGYVGGTGAVETGDIRVDFDRTQDGRIILEFSPR
ncbi:hypothetical protein GCM10018793_46830 [Streptomyces sulfonofaciens]|uniref:Uncharacterized protein n=2 Tax=Streptomyces sulfonofaciens TaxID=68272 RepID=A0A919L4M2_9ACTN|nr:hypothetical protein GCM10018793_46830 [Streptomyces sulfonofaciens]